MKIFLSFLQSKIQHNISAYSFWEYYIKNGIVEAGHTWVEAEDVDWAYGLVPQTEESLLRWKSQVWEKTLLYLKANGADVFLSYLYPNQIDEQAINEIKKMGVLSVNFFCDNVRNFKKIPKIFGVFDNNWVPEYKALAMYKKAGIPAMHLPMPMWVEPQYRKPLSIENGNLSFIGSRDIQRQLFFEDFFNEHTDLLIDIYGATWLTNEEKPIQTKSSFTTKTINQLSFIKKFGLSAFINKLKSRQAFQPLSNQLKIMLKPKPNHADYIKITRESNIVIGINRYPSFRYPVSKPDSYSRLRDLEAPMLGACYLTEWTEGLDQLYEIGKEIEVFTDTTSLKDKIEELNADALKRKQLRDNGQKRALNDHSIPVSLGKLLEA
ncbi:glycosyltransferase [Pedobacter fastidiosus]|uniref:Glycosyltransferase family 1 protein n=1 Tax=Pedobacter fastidiosus TaxID=2765361 RepID=A0ABR7KVT7_9SPHI|nr:glycosyltransferase [Pedobacter fastidiosus]MBC6112161.1 glycosyltransferase family 1 protein [Pedobacter fastidiosus]